MRMTLTSRTDFLLLYKETAEKLMQIVVLTDFGTKNIENLWECKQAEKRQVFWAGTAQQVPRLRRR
jgi:hypothetical protein